MHHLLALAYHGVTEIIDYFRSVPTSTWETIGLVVASAPVVSTLVEIVKRKFKLTEDKYGVRVKKYVVALLGLVSLLGSYLVNFIQYGTNNPHFLGSLTPQIMVAALVAYRIIKNPVFGRVTNWLAVESEVSKQLTATGTQNAETTPLKDSLF
jgi:hypothetical protein